MKELSTEEKAKRYDEAIKLVNSKWHYKNQPCIIDVSEIFPELRASEDERIRKWLLDFVQGLPDEGLDFHFYNLTKEEVLTWLEKQGQHEKFHDSIQVGDKVTRNEEGVLVNLSQLKRVAKKDKKQGEQKPANKVKSKFKIGDWVVEPRDGEPDGLWHIDGIEDGCYCSGKCGCLIEYADKNFHLWTIQDARDGDVLACNEEILLFKSYSVQQGRISLYCWYNGHTNNFHSKEVVDILLTTRNKVCPVTKEQRNTFFARMREAGYEWSDKKELIKL